ncbi:hypothetical protein KMW28_26985 [Flammeovirga yaeyamensis]|uniref:Uncharacterized protein n=1 Tax=Flammeovirga yaeyamensis TaxID=367791 RepID=A0AAX1NAF8_9BACT|nr:hypothetical protein [Flammeovirga yaeyamensis]MBB3700078.1 hypothetical protein [Flammeovirga yaeyamensis]NMF37488.1 hypothetical protein [Flammeovirga yaeyamensis]QWG04545.1 hypothetical protein KMW28_26985 [Flammeovirga yaeyamensis]
MNEIATIQANHFDTEKYKYIAKIRELMNNVDMIRSKPLYVELTNDKDYKHYAKWETTYIKDNSKFEQGVDYELVSVTDELRKEYQLNSKTEYDIQVTFNTALAITKAQRGKHAKPYVEEISTAVLKYETLSSFDGEIKQTILKVVEPLLSKIDTLEANQQKQDKVLEKQTALLEQLSDRLYSSEDLARMINVTEDELAIALHCLEIIDHTGNIQPNFHYLEQTGKWTLAAKNLVARMTEYDVYDLNNAMKELVSSQTSLDTVADTKFFQISKTEMQDRIMQSIRERHETNQIHMIDMINEVKDKMQLDRTNLKQHVHYELLRQ